MSAVYVIGNEIGPVKIGYSSDPIARLRNLQTAHFQVLSVLFLLHHKFSKLVEAKVHEKLNEKRAHGEWFNVSLADAKKAIKFCAAQISSDGNDPSEGRIPTYIRLAPSTKLKLERAAEKDGRSLSLFIARLCDGWAASL